MHFSEVEVTCCYIGGTEELSKAVELVAREDCAHVELYCEEHGVLQGDESAPCT